jgi:hypothetical protein
MHEAAFGTSEGELFLFACAIKYAAAAGKTVHVTCGGGRNSSAGPDSKVSKDFSVEGVYRDTDHFVSRSRERR